MLGIFYETEEMGTLTKFKNFGGEWASAELGAF